MHVAYIGGEELTGIKLGDIDEGGVTYIGGEELTGIKLVDIDEGGVAYIGGRGLPVLNSGISMKGVWLILEGGAYRY